MLREQEFLRDRTLGEEGGEGGGPENVNTPADYRLNQHPWLAKPFRYTNARNFQSTSGI